MGFPIGARYAHPDYGYADDRRLAAEHLQPGRVYTVLRLDVDGFHSSLRLDEPGIRDIEFNAVLFEAAALPSFDAWDEPQEDATPAPRGLEDARAAFTEAAETWAVTPGVTLGMLSGTGPVTAYFGLLLLAAVDAALRHHEPEHFYGNASTEEEPHACPHAPGAACHFEDDGEWLCKEKPEGTVCCSCTEDGLPVAWPCPEYAAILAALGGEKHLAARSTGKEGSGD